MVPKWFSTDAASLGPKGGLSRNGFAKGCPMSQRLLIALATLGSVALLGGAFAFQYIGGLFPCHLCLQQRWPHAAAIIIGLVALTLAARAPQGGPLTRLLAGCGALAAAATAGLGVYHTGVERSWWAGPDTCSAAGDIGAMSAEDLLNQILAAPVIRCTDVQWDMLGLSMASWNAVISAALMLVWIAALRTRR
jgi:disulfide bond formation protein DsbB